MGKVYIVQHCQSEHHVNELTGGSTDTPLTSLGIQQAKSVAEELRLLGLTNFRLFSSDLRRAYMTAERIASEFSQEIHTVKELREINNGEAANKTKEWASKNRLYSSNVLEIDKRMWKESETPRELFQRMNKIIIDYILDTEEDLVIVSHGIAIAYLIGAWLGFTPEDMKSNFIKGYAGGISCIEVSQMGQNMLSHFNITTHLRGLN